MKPEGHTQSGNCRLCVTGAMFPKWRCARALMIIINIIFLAIVVAAAAVEAEAEWEGAQCGSGGVGSMVELIQKKRDGGELSAREMWAVVSGFHNGAIPDYQMAAMLMAMYIRGMTDRETTDMTLSFMRTGEIADLSSLGKTSIDKHSTGGVGDKVSLALAPLVASFGLVVPMMSGRGLGHTGGTLDKLESLPGVGTALTSADFLQQLRQVGVAICGPTESIAPVDKAMYALRDVTGTAASLPLIVASIMSKKLAEGPDALLLDVKTGDGAFLPEWESAHKLAQAMLAAGELASKRMTVVMTDMSQPLGRAVGNWLELREAIDVLSGRGPEDVRELVVVQCALMLVLAGQAPSYLTARQMAEKHLGNGEGLRQLRLLVRAQGGRQEAEAYIASPDTYPASARSLEVRASQAGWVAAIGAREIGAVNVLLGGGRADKDAKIDPKAGIVLARKVGDAVSAGDLLATLYSDVQAPLLQEAADRVLRAYSMSDVPVAAPPLVGHILVNGSAMPWSRFVEQQQPPAS